jgi:hypothetical protein
MYTDDYDGYFPFSYYWSTGMHWHKNNYLRKDFLLLKAEFLFYKGGGAK